MYSSLYLDCKNWSFLLIMPLIMILTDLLEIYMSWCVIVFMLCNPPSLMMFVDLQLISLLIYGLYVC